jgi:hypothetical protein
MTEALPEVEVGHPRDSQYCDFPIGPFLHIDRRVRFDPF